MVTNHSEWKPTAQVTGPAPDAVKRPQAPAAVTAAGPMRAKQEPAPISAAEDANIRLLADKFAAGSQAAMMGLAMVEEELRRWEGAGQAAVPKHGAAGGATGLSKTEISLARHSSRDPDAVVEAIAPFIRASLGSAPAVLHNVAARALAALVIGAAMQSTNGPLYHSGIRALVNELLPFLHQEGDGALPLTAPLRACVHSVMELSGPKPRLLYAMPALTRHGATVVPAPPKVVATLREAYFRSLAQSAARASSKARAGSGSSGSSDSDSDGGDGDGSAYSAGGGFGGGGGGGGGGSDIGLPPDPTYYQRAGNRSIIYDGLGARSDDAERAQSADSAVAGGTPTNIPAEWAALPESLHWEILEGLRPHAEAWCGHALTSVRFFGVRRYLRGAALENHVDSDPRVRAIGISISVDAEALEADWSLCAEGAEGDAAAAPLPVGQMFIYEACRVRHCRPAPLQANVFANAFCHYTLSAWA